MGRGRYKGDRGSTGTYLVYDGDKRCESVIIKTMLLEQRCRCQTRLTQDKAHESQ